MHRGLPTEKIFLSPQFYQHIFTSLRPQMWKGSCKSGLSENSHMTYYKPQWWPSGKAGVKLPACQVMANLCMLTEQLTGMWKKIISFGFSFLSSLVSSLHNIFFFEQKLRHQILDTAETSLFRRPFTDSFQGRYFAHHSRGKVRAAVQLLHSTERC